MSGRRRFRPWTRPLIVGIAAALLGALLIWGTPLEFLSQQRERGFDVLTLLRPAPLAPQVIVVDIDRKAEGADGSWQWSRGQTAKLIEVVAAAKPAAIALDLVFSAECDPEATDNAALAAAIGKAPVVLGFLMSDIAGLGPRPPLPIALRTPVETPSIWFADGAEASCTFLQTASKGAGMTSLLGDSDARVRAAAGVVAVGETLYPGLAVAALAVARQAGTMIFGGVPPFLRLGQQTLPVDASANLRFRATGPDEWALRTVSALDVVEGKIATERFAGAVVFIGSSVPRFGALRPTATSPLEPSVQIHADLASGILASALPFRDGRFALYEALAVLVLGIGLVGLCLLLRPLAAAGLALGVVVLWLGGTVAAHWVGGWLVDPLLPPLVLLIVYALTSVLHYAEIKSAEANLRRRFGQHLPAALVTRFVENPNLLKLEGEERIVTALFADVEGFTTTTRLAGPRELIAMLDGYFEGVTKLIVQSGGMVDKFVGDAVHAFFNAPLDLPDHVDRAIACAQAIEAFAEEFRHRPENQRFGFGRTRIGIESGNVVVGDVGAGEKIDYTAYGNAINLAARLEQANKDFGTALLVGPGAQAQSKVALRSLGEIDIRGFGRLEVFTLGEKERGFEGD